MNYWNRKVKFFEGFSDSELRKAIDKRVIKKLDRQQGTVNIPWLFWPSENYGFGKCFRKELDWPNFLPLPFFSDHGVAIESVFLPIEQNNPAKYFFTFYNGRYEALKDLGVKEVARITHPWINYRKEMGYEIAPEAKGTLIFYAHTIVGVELEDFDDDEYFAQLKALPDSYHPLVICLHQHDIKKGLHEKLRKYDIPIVTMGYTSSQNFVDRFYQTVSHFRYATSCEGGSELYYCQELGVDYFILGRKPKYVNHSHDSVPLGEVTRYDDQLHLDTKAKKREIFTFDSKATKEDRLVFSFDGLACDGNKNIMKLSDYKNELKKEMVRLMPHYFKVVFNMATQKLKSKVFSMNRSKK